MHGELLKARCSSCNAVSFWDMNLTVQTSCASCGRKGGMRPHVVWFGEMPFMMDTIAEALGRCGLFLSIGTSGNVYPAAGFVQTVRQAGTAQTVEISLEPSEGASLFDDGVYGPATEMVPQVVDQILRYTA